MDRIKREIDQFDEFLHKFNNTPEQDWSDNDVSSLAGRLKVLIANFSQTAQDYGLTSTGEIEAPKSILEDLQQSNSKINYLKKQAIAALDYRSSQCDCNTEAQ